MLEDLGVGVVPVRVYFGSENYLDKVTITPSEFYGRFAVTDEAPKTSQPPPADFTQVYENVATHAGSIVSVHLSAERLGDLPGGGRRGAPGRRRRRSTHVDSRQRSVGLGLVVRAAAEAAAAGKSAEEVAHDRARTAADACGIFVAVPTLKHLVRGGRVSPPQGHHREGCSACCPILTITREGKVEPAGKARGYAAARRKMMRLALRRGRRARQRLPPVRRRALRRRGRGRGDGPRDPRPLSRVRRDDRRVRTGARRARRAGRARRGGAAVAVLTLGHSNRSLEDFLALLAAHRVDRILDVRRYPVSRKWPHFDAAPLASALRAAGVDYAGLPELGGRRKPRPDSAHVAWREEGFRGFADFMESPEFEAGLARLRALSDGARAALLCAEALPWKCHRSLIADALVARGETVEDILSTGKARPHRLPAFARVTAEGRLAYDGEAEAWPSDAALRGEQQHVSRPRRDARLLPLGDEGGERAAESGCVSAARARRWTAFSGEAGLPAAGAPKRPLRGHDEEVARGGLERDRFARRPASATSKGTGRPKRSR